MADERTPTELDALAEEWLDTLLDLEPELHIHLGRPGRESDYADRSPEGHAAAADAARSMLARVRGADTVDSVDAITQAELIRTLGLDVEQHAAGFWQRDLNVIASPGQDLRDIFDLMSTETDDDWSHIAKRMNNLPTAMAGYLESLRAGIAAGNVPAIRQVREVSAQAAKQLDKDSFFHGLAVRGPEALAHDLQTGVTAATEAYATMVFHEGVPGHHLQCGLAVYNSAELNGWRRMNWNSGHGEGWALYAERLMAELGYLDDPADRLGMLDGQRMRAARVVVDIGVHLGKPKPDGSGTWTGEYAFEFMAQHVNMSEPFVRFEVNRYLGWPGQAPSYKVGQRIWEQLRTEWVATNGTDLKEFHRRALGVGSVGLGTLRQALLG